MRRRKLALRAALRGVLSRALGRERARAAYDVLSAARELIWNSWRRRLYPSFWRRAIDERRRSVLRYALHGEFGDALLALPFLFRQRRRYPRRRIEVVIKGGMAGSATRSAADPYSEAGLRFMTAAGGPVNFLAEVWSRVGFVDAVSEGNVSDPQHHYWQPQPWIALQGGSVGPADYRPFLDGLFSDEDRRTAGELWASRNRPLRVVAHLRRSAGEIAALAGEIDACALAGDVVVAIVGSRRHEAIPELRWERVALLDLTDNYERGIGIMPLLQTLRTAHLFIGGRGGFELFALAAGVPAITVFDDDGWWEQRRLWPERLWSENPLGIFLEAARFDAADAFRTHVEPWLRSCARRIEGARAA